MKIAHLSDLHLNTFYSDSNLDKIKVLLRYACEKGFDHLVITGDLTDNASPKDFEILRKLFKSFGLLNGERLSLVIGNHDIFGGIQTAEDILSFPERCCQIDFELKVKEFRDYFSETFENCIYESPFVFPYAKIIKNNLLIGINSIAKYSKLKNPFASNGEIDLSQYNEIDEILTGFGNDVKSRILLIHHHFNKIKIDNNSRSNLWLNIEKQTMKLRKKKRLLRLFNNYKVDLILHGHLHENMQYERDGIKFFNAGGCIKGEDGNVLRLNFINPAASPVETRSCSIYPGDKITESVNVSSLVIDSPAKIPELLN